MHRLLSVVLAPISYVFTIFIVLLPMLLLGETDVPSALAPQDYEIQTPMMRATEIALYRVGALSRFKIQRSDGEDDEEGILRDEIQLREVNTTGLSSCSSNSVAAAIVVAETMARPNFRRELEHASAQVVQAILGIYPDWSYGLSQTRLSVAQKALQNAILSFERLELDFPTVTEERTFTALTQSDLCDAVALAGIVLATEGNSELPAKDAAIAYRGGPSTGDLPGVFTYELLVENLADRLRSFGLRNDLRIGVRPSGNSDELNDFYGVPSWSGDTSVFYPHVCLTRHDERAPFTGVDLYLPRNDTSAPSEAISLGLGPVSEFFESIQSEDQSLNIRLRTWNIDAATDAFREGILEQNGEVQVETISEVYSIANILAKIGLGLDRDWDSVDIDYFETPEDVYDERYPCPVEISISNSGPGMFAGQVFK